MYMQNTCVRVAPSRIHLLCGHAKCRMVIDELLVVNSYEKILTKDFTVDHDGIISCTWCRKLPCTS